jgi:putative DNA primase/helicase
MMLGPCRGGVVRLGEPSDVLMIGEGIETCLAAMQAAGNPAWAALSTSGLRSLDLPHDARDRQALEPRRTPRSDRPPAARHGF